MTYRVLVLLSGSGTLFAALAEHLKGRDDIEIVAVGADRECAGLDRARDLGLPTFALPLAKGADRAVWDDELTDRVAAHRPDLVVSAGFMKLLGAKFLAQFGGRTINTHPALLPSFPGMHGARDALAHGVKVTGATVFMVDDGVDTGQILAQGAVDVAATDTAESLHERIKVVERLLLCRTVDELAQAGATAPANPEPSNSDPSTAEGDNHE
ncbi:phosphoribosylglycinamide formyltransferase [Propionibacteriaceae bacterium G1746]|uniref:phosphoribosylglycinamide formyltransferase n=1 Tax=Aestuariimicrobium sp. G57 TaxID=3418485 RepID=UPI003C1BD2F1